MSYRVEIINDHEQLHPSASVDTLGDTVHPSNMDVSHVCLCVFVCVCVLVLTAVYSPVQQLSVWMCVVVRVGTDFHCTIF